MDGTKDLQSRTRRSGRRSRPGKKSRLALEPLALGGAPQPAAASLPGSSAAPYRP